MLAALSRGTGILPVVYCGTGILPVVYCGTDILPVVYCGTGILPVVLANATRKSAGETMDAALRSSALEARLRVPLTNVAQPSPPPPNPHQDVYLFCR